ncbi:hypothetical protein Fot_32669 [Forsythia ovata]|uniref:Uncharacterized protein n=1 Tax=Forsythia ovata TaxID=205694 RepID=A0ABD1T8G3_9LAMI
MTFGQSYAVKGVISNTRVHPPRIIMALHSSPCEIQIPCWEINRHQKLRATIIANRVKVLLNRDTTCHANRFELILAGDQHYIPRRSPRKFKASPVTARFNSILEVTSVNYARVSDFTQLEQYEAHYQDAFAIRAKLFDPDAFAIDARLFDQDAFAIHAKIFDSDAFSIDAKLLDHDDFTRCTKLFDPGVFVIISERDID